MEITVETNHLGHFIGMTVLILMAIGTVFVFSAGANLSFDYNLQYFCDFTTLKHILFFPLAVATMFTFACIDYRRFSFTRAGMLKSLTPYLFVVSTALLVLVLCIGPKKNGACRWLFLTIGPISISFQPSELAKWATVFFMAAFLDKFAGTMKLYWKRFVPACLVACIIIGLIITQDVGTAAFISLLTFLMLIIGGARWWHFLTPLPFISSAFYFAIVLSPSRLKRLKDFINPDVIPYQTKQSLLAIGSGGIWGKGLGKGISKYGYLPADTSDFIFSIIAEELGFIGAAVVIGLFVLIILLAIILIGRCKDRFGPLLAGGITVTIAIQAAINIGVVTDILPTKGIPLPFISAGGTCILLSAAAVGLLVNIAKQTGEIQQ